VPFFEKPKPPKPRKRSRKLRRDTHGRPTLELPGSLAEDAVIAVSDEAAVMLRGFACYPSGFAFELAVTTRYEISDFEDPLHGDPFGLWGRRPDGAGRFGVAFSDGRRATLERPRSMPEPAAAPISIVPGGGGGGAGYYASGLFVQPLPPPGPVTFAVEWKSAGIEETLHTIDGELFIEAAKRAKRVFPPTGARS
jgi:hypothetical protein